MHLNDIARAILFGDRWEDKLCFNDKFEDPNGDSALIEAPSFPGRPAALGRFGRAEFPTPAELGSAAGRGRLLHFFANHELLAMELMALVLLKFPDAPKAFRAGLARTIAEEQNHLRLYVDRMRELGVDFGELLVSDYFWNAMKDTASPLQFVTQMSLTLEQANLDFSLFYQKAVAAVGDEKTAAILERVYREEIGHVKHGVTWFNRWRGEEGDDWEAYLRLLPPPMTPRRAKGPEFSGEARREAGLSERFIRELEVHAGSKGRPPAFWFFNPHCDAEIARGKPGFSASESARRLAADLETVPLFLARETDVVLVERLPRAEWLKKMQSLGFVLPEFRVRPKLGDFPRETKIGGVEPWGWSPDPFERFRGWRDRLIPLAGANGEWCRAFLERDRFPLAEIGALFSKEWSVSFLRDWIASHPDRSAVFGGLETVGAIYRDEKAAREKLSDVLSRGEKFLAKAPWGTSGMQNKRVLEQNELDSTLGGWIRNVIASQGAVILEPWLDKQADLSMQIEVARDAIRVVGIRQFATGARFEYRGTSLDAKLRDLPPAVLRFVHSEKKPLEAWRELALGVGAALRARGYLGPAGLDALIAPDATGDLFIKPLVELNPRWTMGRVAIALENHVAPGTPARWIFISSRELAERKLPENFRDAVAVLEARRPAQIENFDGGPRVVRGVIATTDPDRAEEVVTLLVVGHEALADNALRVNFSVPVSFG